MQDAAGADDGNVNSGPYFRYDDAARAIRSQMPACFCTFDNDGRSTQGLGYFS